MKLLRNLLFGILLTYGGLILAVLLNLIIKGGEFSGPWKTYALGGLVVGIIFGVALSIGKSR